MQVITVNLFFYYNILASILPYFKRTFAISRHFVSS